MKILLLSLLSVFIQPDTTEFKLRNGDLIFQESYQGNMTNAIKEVTSSIDEYQFTHVGIVYIDEYDQIFVIEATHPKVKKTPLKEYLYPEEKKDCYPLSVVGRLNEEYQPLIPKAIKEAFTHIGKEYDDGFVLNNDKYYCSELIYDILLEANDGKPVFELNVMTFKSPETNEIAEGWQKHFSSLQLPIPEGEPGINPGAMSKSEIIDIIYIY